MTVGVQRLERVSLTVEDLAAASRFYVDVLGFTRMAGEIRRGAAFADLMAIDDAHADVEVLRLGREEIELVAFVPGGRPYPSPRTAEDPWFQHMAIVVSDMPAAYAALVGSAMAPVSTGGPQRLPASTGGITAYKFRDPEGRPLELSYFPAGVGAPEWRDPAPDRCFLGIDHSAVAVADVERSVAFYTAALGFRVAERLVNAGPTQARLDGLDAPVVDIVVLNPADDASAHLELLGYRTPIPPPPQAWRPDDVVATRLMYRVEGLADLLARLPPAAIVSRGPVTQDDGSRAAMVRDPDGHLLVLREPESRGL